MMMVCWCRCARDYHERVLITTTEVISKSAAMLQPIKHVIARRIVTSSSQSKHKNWQLIVIRPILETLRMVIAATKH